LSLIPTVALPAEEAISFLLIQICIFYSQLIKRGYCWDYGLTSTYILKPTRRKWFINKSVKKVLIRRRWNLYRDNEIFMLENIAILAFIVQP
jgi:hypothetical protein